MNAAPMPAVSAIFGSREHLDVSRALGELQARRPVRVRASGEDLIALPVEGLDDQRLREFSMLCSSEIPRLIVTQQRARAIGIETSTPMALSLSRAADASGVLELAAGNNNKSHFIAEAEAADYAATAAIRLVKLVRGLPAILAARTTAIDNDVIQSISVIDADAVHRFVADATSRLAVASEATIPLASGTSARFVVFRDALGVDQVAIIVGKPDEFQTCAGSTSLGLSDRRRLRLAPLRLRRPASTGACPPGKPRWRHHSVSCAGGPRNWPCKQDACLPPAGWWSRYARCQHHARVRG